MAHAVVHFEISGPDASQLADFYASLFGWTMSPVPGAGYTLVDTSAGSGINGGIAATPDGAAAVTFYIETDDMQAALDKINLLGGKTETPITELAGMVTFAQFADPDGLLIGLVLAPSDPAEVMAPSPGTGAPVDWFEVLGSDRDRSQRFYAEIFGWEASAAGPGYAMVDTGTSRGIKGGLGVVADQGSWATVYASVPDVEAILTRAVELGGAREYGPNPVDDHMQTGALRDPAGNVFGVYHHAPH
ncbi:MAG TPA: VOC family protein [Streptosporangiaceae bacterium]|nr:VOC family protein [Streptosporangiaceae bacterium]